MAEQDACAQVVADAANEAEVSCEEHVSGESLLLPLLQGLLDAEEGEAAEEARRALREALRAPAALRALAARLLAGLAAPAAGGASRSSRRRRARSHRHTVAVTEEELSAARRLVEDAELAGRLRSPGPRDLQKQASCGALLERGSRELAAESAESAASSLESSRADSLDAPIEEPITLHEAAAAQPRPAPVVSSASYDASPMRNVRPVLADFSRPEKIKPPPPSELPVRYDPAPAQQQPAPVRQQLAPVRQQLAPAYNMPPLEEIPRAEHTPDVSESETEPVTVVNRYDTATKPSAPAPLYKEINHYQAPTSGPEPERGRPTRRVPLYQPLPPTYNFAAAALPPINGPPRKSLSYINGEDESSHIFPATKPMNRFTSKKSRMKRANTIDIPKPLNFYQVESDLSDDDAAKYQRGNAAVDMPKVPTFQPKTDNDHKFAAFIQKHNSNDSGSLWSGDKVAPQSAGPNWNSCFGNIKNTFENRTDRSRSSSSSSARQFWKASDDLSVNTVKTPNYGPKLTKKGAQNLQTLHDNKEKQVKLPWTAETKGDVVTGTLKVSGPNAANGIIEARTKKFVAKPIPVNQFSHAPMSAFKPPMKIVSPVTAPAHIWSPPTTALNDTVPPQKSTLPTFNNPIENHLPALPKQSPIAPKSPMAPKSPIAPTAPWAVNVSDKPKRVLSLAASKFENSQNQNQIITSPQPPPPPAFKAKTFAPLQTRDTNANVHLYKSIPTPGHLSAPQLVRKMDGLKNKFENGSIHADEVVEFPPKFDAQKLQIEFYEKQILKNTKNHNVSDKKVNRNSLVLPSPYTYTVTDYTPPQISTFIPLQQTPDIEKTKSNAADRLPDVVLNEHQQILDNYTKSPINMVNNHKPVINKQHSLIVDDDHVIPGYKEHNSVSPLNRSPQSDYINNGYDAVDPVEYQAVTKVMRGPVSQQAVIKTNGVQTRNDDEGGRGNAAKSLKGVLQKFSSPKHEVLAQIEKKKNQHNDVNGQIQQIDNISKPVKPSVAPAQVNQRKDLNSHTPIRHNFDTRPEIRNIPTIKYEEIKSPTKAPVKPMEFKVRNNIFNVPKDLVYSSDSLDLVDDHPSRILKKPPTSTTNKIPISPVHSTCSTTPSPTSLSRSESWHQLANHNKTSPSISPRNKVVSRTRSMHHLSVPKQFEAGIARDQIQEKRKTVEAYFSGQVSPHSLSKSNSQQTLQEHQYNQNFGSQLSKSPGKPRYTSINRTKTADKVSTQSFILGRSQTMPQIHELKLLDESNADDAFENLLNDTFS